MKKNMINRVHLEGKLYQHKLERKTTGANSKAPGTEYIRGTIEVATDDNVTNIVSVNYTYVTAKYSSGKENPNFKILGDIIDGKYQTCITDGAASATNVSIDTSIGVNDFYSNRQTDENGDPVLVSAKRNDGGFIRIVKTVKTDEKARNTFNADIVITGFTIKEADEEKGLPEKGIIKGATFDFKNALLPVEFSVINSNAISYFEGLNASAKEPVFTQVKGTQVSEVVKKTITIEGAFGDEVKEVENSRKDWIVTWAQADPYEWDTEETITSADLKKAMTDRQTYLAEVKARYEESQKNKESAPASSNDGDAFNF